MPVSETEAHERLAAAERALGTEDGATPEVHTALSTARKALRWISLGLLRATEERARRTDPPPPLPSPSREPR